MAGIRIAGLEEVTTLNENMVLATDGPDGTKKINADSMMEQYANSSQMINNPLAVVGSAQQLIGDTGADDTTPYLYRKTPYASDRNYLRKLVGGSVVWNQLVGNGDFSNGTSGWESIRCSKSVDNGVLTLTVTTSFDGSIPLLTRGTDSGQVIGDKYAVICDIFLPTTNITMNRLMFGLRGTPAGDIYASDSWQRCVIVEESVSTRGVFVLGVTKTVPVGDTVKVRNVMTINLTQVFGPEIADYIYTLEQSQTGSGIAYLKSYGFLTEDYYTTDSGSIQSVSVSGKKVVGFNQWDEEWRNGYYSYGTYVSSNNYVCSKNACQCLPNTEYYGYYGYTSSGRIVISFYDSNMDFIQNVFIKNENFTSPDRARYFNLYFENVMTDYANNCCINISKPTGTPKNGDYLPYTITTYILPHDTLRGIIKKDANNNLYFDGDIYKVDGKLTRKFGIVDMGTLTWELVSTSGSNYRFKANLYGVKIPSEQSSVPKIICSKYMTVSPVRTYLGYTGISINNQAEQVVVCDMSYSDAETFKIAMSGVMLVYELATPITTTEPAYQSLQIVDGDGTEKMVDYLVEQGDRDVAIPVGNETTYLPDLKQKLEDLPQIPPAPTTEGTYTLTATVSGGTATYTWE